MAHRGYADTDGKVFEQSRRDERGRVPRVIVYQREQARFRHNSDQTPYSMVVPAPRGKVSDGATSEHRRVRDECR